MKITKVIIEVFIIVKEKKEEKLRHLVQKLKKNMFVLGKNSNKEETRCQKKAPRKMDVVE